MKRFGIVSYNIYCNFTNYGSALQSWALQQAVDRLGRGRWESVLVDYCPDVLRDKDPRNPMEHMWDTDAESRRLCEMSLPAILKNADRFDRFYQTMFRRTSQAYTSENFNQIMREELLDGFICGSDTIFCIDEFGGFDDGYYANYPCMQKRAAAYAASFGDSHFAAQDYHTLNDRLKNFQALGLRENAMLSYVREQTAVPVQRVLDPTLLLTAEDYDRLAAPRLGEQPYLLLYARRYNPEMWEFAERLAAEHGWKIVEISLRAINAQKHRMFYEAGVEEFLSLVRYAQFVVTNSYHGMIFSVQYQKEFCVFSREQGESKITELLELLGLSNRLMTAKAAACHTGIDYERIHRALAQMRGSSLNFLECALTDMCDI